MHTTELREERGNRIEAHPISEMDASEKLILVEQYIHVLKKKRNFLSILIPAASILIFFDPGVF